VGKEGERKGGRKEGRKGGKKGGRKAKDMSHVVDLASLRSLVLHLHYCKNRKKERKGKTEGGRGREKEGGRKSYFLTFVCSEVSTDFTSKFKGLAGAQPAFLRPDHV
jgi:hypothetical protein